MTTNKEATSDSRYIISLHNVTKVFHGATEVTALQDVSLDIAKGEIFGIIGLSRRKKHPCAVHKSVGKAHNGRSFVLRTKPHYTQKKAIVEGTARNCHDFSKFQPFSATHRSEKRHVSHDGGQKFQQATCFAVVGNGGAFRQKGLLPVATFRRTKTACGNCTCACLQSQGFAVRRGNKCTGQRHHGVHFAVAETNQPNFGRNGGGNNTRNEGSGKHLRQGCSVGPKPSCGNRHGP